MLFLSCYLMVSLRCLMKRIHYTNYFLEQLEFREIPWEIVEAILNKAVERYFDVETERLSARLLV